MTIGFVQIPLTVLTPGVYAEFDSSLATKGAQIQPHEVLLVGNMTSSGSATAASVTQPRSVDEAGILFGTKSRLYQMFKAYRKKDSLTPVSCIPLADNGSGVAATGSITWTGTATETGVQSFYVGGRRVPVTVPSGTNAASLETLALAEFALYPDMPVTVAANASTGLDFTAANDGASGNEIFLGVSLMPGERNVAGLTFTVNAMASGATESDHSAAITAMGEDQYHTVVLDLTDSTEVTRYVTELESRANAMRQIEGVAFVCKYDTAANLTTYGNGKNSFTLVAVGAEKSALLPLPWETAALVAADSALQTQIDPATNCGGHILPGAAAPAKGTRYTRAQRNTLLSDGISTLAYLPDGRVAIERLVTTYQTNALALPDTAYQDLHPTVRTLFAIRYALRARLGVKFQGFKLADDGNEISGQKIATPKIIKSELLALFGDLRDLGWVESPEQFQDELLVERDVDPNRINLIFPPDIINNLLVTAASIQFRR